MPKIFQRISTFFLFALLGFSLTATVTSSEPSTFKLVLLPDTQIYAMRYPDTFYAQTKWIADHAGEIAFVLHQGDITNNNTEAQWNVARFSMGLLDGKVSYCLFPGNHDLGRNGSTDSRDTTLMNRFFPLEEYSKIKGFGGVFEPGKIDNNWMVFRAGGVDWLILSLEFGPRNSVLDWACRVVEQHPEHRIIINTHAYMFRDDTRMGEGDKNLPQIYPIGKATGDDAVNDGEMIWEKLVSHYPNVLFVFSGHVDGTGVGRLVSQGRQGNSVYQMLANYQNRPKGGEGFLRILTMDTESGTVDVKTYSPLINRFDESPEHQFRFDGVDFRFSP